MAKQGKSKIIDTAFHLFLKKGYQGTSIQDITSATGLSKGALYYHFQSKRDIYLAVVKRFYFKQMKLMKADDSDRSLHDRIRNRCEIFCQLCEYVEQSGSEGLQYPLRAFFIFQLESERDDIIREQIILTLDSFRAEVIDMVQLAKDKGEVKVNLEVKVIAYQLISMIEGIAVHHSTIEQGGSEFLRNKYLKVIGAYLDLITATTNK